MKKDEKFSLWDILLRGASGGYIKSDVYGDLCICSDTYVDWLSNQKDFVKFCFMNGVSLRALKIKYAKEVSRNLCYPESFK